MRFRSGIRRFFKGIARPIKGLAITGLVMAGLAWGGWQLFVWQVPAFDMASTIRAEGLAGRLSPSRIVTDREGRLLRAFTAADGRWRLPVSSTEVSKTYLKLLLNFEDRRFHQHNGVELKAFARAFWQLLKNRRIISGGSTLSMQTARLITGRHDRSLATKFWQIRTAIGLEKTYSKTEILELYLRLTPFGGNIEGVRAASLAYFGKEPKRLSLAEAATLVALPQSPEARRPDRFPARAMAARDRVLKRALDNGKISREDYLYAKRARLAKARYAFPLWAAHAAEKLASDDKSSAIIQTRLSRPLQIKLEGLARRHAEAHGKGLSAAVIVVDLEGGDVLAHVGSANYRDEARFGPIDMTERVRSPGSTLKPFIYGMGFDAGMAHPEMLIEDAPVRYGLYAPENFDGKFSGLVTVRQALQKSLNIPAVKMLAAIKPSRFAVRFRAAGFENKIPHNLTVALGGVGFSLKELARAYMEIARPGHGLELAYVKAGANNAAALSGKALLSKRPLMSEKAAYYITHILRGAPPPKNAKPGALAYKTGTSYGYRDAWAVGFDGRHLAAVWIGRPDGGPTSELTGIKTAGPLLFDVFQHIGETRVPYGPPPKGVIMARGDDLPPPLRVFDKKKQRLTAATGKTQVPLPKIAFPPEGAEFHLTPQTKLGLPLPLKAEGGKLPLTWLVNGKIVPSKAHLRQHFYQVGTRGFVEFSVIDALGRSDRVSVRVR